MSDTKTRDPIRESAERFAADTTSHQLIVLHDDGLYRHLRFAQPSPHSWLCWFDLITWPGNLAIRGDCGSYMFARVDDMFEFFRGSRINPGYWAEKTPGGTQSCRSYSREVFEQHVAERLADAEQDWPGITAAWKEANEVDYPDYDMTYEDHAHEALRDFHYPLTASRDQRRFEFSDSWEWDLREFDWTYLWCCYAIQRGIQQYDAARTPATSGSAA
jgi:hypothetical protein